MELLGAETPVYCVSKNLAWPYVDSCLSLKSAKIIDDNASAIKKSPSVA